MAGFDVVAVVMVVVVIVSELLSKFCFSPSKALFPLLLAAVVTVDDGVDFLDALLSFELDPVFGDDLGDGELFAGIAP